MAAAVAAAKKEWTACLAKSGGAPGKCEKLEKELVSTSKAAGVECCVAETVGLMRCTGTSSKANGCGAEFLAMRECNRAGGRQLMQGMSGGYEVAPGKGGLFSSAAPSLVGSVVPARSLLGMQDFGESYAASMGIHQGEVRF
mmetsp:Transcript_116540/g.370665  ORF Transcript_116540/g.370665 Transcript_116540/m.370665 type:complete len:142 (+) Transcript_116540:73-498(+)